ncbi:Pao retrotransposon peptidase, partial [Trichostrongylus colubriformis]
MEEWPEECKLFRLTNAEEENTHVSNMVSAEAQEELLDWRRQRSLLFSQNVVGYVLRFIKKLLNRVNTELRERVMKNIPQIRSAETLPYITAKEKEAALRVIIRNHQSVHLPTAKQLALKQLRIREDEDGLLRCQGRLGNASLQTDTRHPYLIASKTNLAQLIVKHAHTPFHCGTGHTMANVRERVWIPKLRQMVRTIIARCVPCQKLNNLPYRYPEMDDLPERRVRRSRPFEHIGIDYFGPLSVKRGEEPAKAYGIILTCATTRLVHLELVPDMSTNHLLLALRRFFARRGIPKSVTSDNGPNFLLGEQILREAVLPVVNDDSLANAVAARGIVWRTITPYAPWQGALYERLIKSIKHSLYKVIQRTIPSQETMETLLTEIEGSVNSRPLTYQEERWEDAPMLRPIDFIQRDMLITYPFEAIETEEENDSYVPASEAIALQSRKQAEDALKTSHQFTERF